MVSQDLCVCRDDRMPKKQHIEISDIYLRYKGFLAGSFGICFARGIVKGDKALLLFCELRSHPGPSITTASEQIRKAGVAWFDQEFPGIDLDENLTMAEHYNDEVVYGGEGDDRWDLLVPGPEQFQSSSKKELAFMIGVPERVLEVTASLLMRPGDPLV